MKRLLAIVAVLTILIFPASTVASRGNVSSLLVAQVVEDTTVTATVPAWFSHSGYLVITTAGLIGVPSLAVTITTAGITADICTVTAITTNTEWVVHIGLPATAATGGVDQVCSFPLTGTTVFTFAVTGTTVPTFTITADMYWLPL